MENHIRQIRHERGLTLDTVASQVECSIPYLSDLELNRRGARPETWKRIAAALGVTVEELKGDEHDTVPDHSASS